MPDLNFKQILIIAGFLVVLVSIPLSFSLLSRTQTLKSQAATKNSPSSLTQQISKDASSPAGLSKEVPQTSPLANLKDLLEASPNPSPTPEAPAATNLAFGPTLNLKINIEGRPLEKNSAKVFVGIAAGTATKKPTHIITFTIDLPDSGTFSGLSLAGLNPGSTYTAYIKGPSQIDIASTFVMSPTESTINNGQPLILLSGDLNEDNTINSADYTIAKNLYGVTSASSNWNSRVDFNNDLVINNLDLAYIIKNFGKTGASDTWYSTPPPIASPSTTATGSGSPLDIIKSTGSATGSATRSGYWLWVPPSN